VTTIIANAMITMTAIALIEAIAAVAEITMIVMAAAQETTDALEILCRRDILTKTAIGDGR
jgi:hypothetical protein